MSVMLCINRNFSPELSYIIHCTQQLVAIRESLPKSRSRLTATRKEVCVRACVWVCVQYM